jgi:diguanylate cyclase (GGDEF)-like protein
MDISVSRTVSLGFSSDDVINKVSLGLIVVGRDWKILLWNDWMSRHSRIASTQALQQNITSLFDQQMAPGFLRALNNVISYGLPSILSSALHRSPLPLYLEQDRSEMPTRMYQSIIMTPLPDRQGQGTNAAACLIQVTDSSTSIKREKMLMSHSDALKRDAVTDGLTGIYNRRFFDESYLLAIRHAKRHSSSLALLMVDIDDFKLYNDSYGHIQGDKVLQQVANVLRSQMRRPADICARYGGEEFVMLMPDMTAEPAREFAQRLCASIAELNIPHATSHAAACITISVGVKVTMPGLDFDGKTLLKAADDALYEAKKQGRNRIVMVD